MSYPRFVIGTLWLLPTLTYANPALLAARDAVKNSDYSGLIQAESELQDHPLQAYPRYWWLSKNLGQTSGNEVQQFLTRYDNTVLAERLRVDWLKQLGKQEQWSEFQREYQKLAPVARDNEIVCYELLNKTQLGQADSQVWEQARKQWFSGRASTEGCQALHDVLFNQGKLLEADVWYQVRLAFSANNPNLARQISQRSNTPLASQQVNSPSYDGDLSQAPQRELALYAVQKQARQNPETAALQLNALEKAGLSREAAGYGWGQLALINAKKLRMVDALAQFARADQKQLNREQWEWWVRAALREGQWDTVQRTIDAMPAEVAAEADWVYWKARALKARGRSHEANPLFARLSQQHHYYGQLAREELGQSVTAPSGRYTPSSREVQEMRQQGSQTRALSLFEISRQSARPELREDAKREWRFAMRGLNDKQLLASAEAAQQAGFYEMAIFSADRTQELHDFNLRYLAPYREITRRYSQEFDVDEAWVYGLMRQESRFVHIARSGVGASGLMQLMPATAKWVGSKLGVSNFSVNQVDTNIQFGTWYLRHVQDTLSGHPVLATAAYNAGPGRARQWQADRALEGAIYAETIPFNETRDYVKKVFANAVYYAQRFGGDTTRLKDRLGVIPAR